MEDYKEDDLISDIWGITSISASGRYKERRRELEKKISSLSNGDANTKSRLMEILERAANSRDQLQSQHPALRGKNIDYDYKSDFMSRKEAY
ncbi:hypothetical protein HYT56_00105 [Candidatus Woesearchaeota archaeon]|nr:hypothetical protein [Candidatus Woesearchaeota archaeon]